MGAFKACTSTVSAAGALLLLLAAPQNLCARADVTERATKISFREKVSLPGGSGSSLMGTGVRVKKIGPAGVKVYAVGLYVDEKAAAKELEVHKGEDGESLGKNDGFFSRVAKSKFEKTMVLKMAREVGTEKMVSALTESVKPRISGSKKPLETFQDILLKAVGKEGAAKKGMQFGFVCKPGALCVSVNGKDAGTIKSGPLSSAMVDVYLGKKAVSPGAKKAFATGVATLLER
ncbi:FAPa [Ectocarpus sp. CCAP 1310/34]|nr:FAPa [Ectocarpus sp. CCAP 1310/34]